MADELPKPYGYVVLGHHFSQSERSARQTAWVCSMTAYASLPITKVYTEEQVRDLLRAHGVAVGLIPPDAITVNLVRFAGLDKHKARECEAIVRQVLAAHGVLGTFNDQQEKP